MLATQTPKSVAELCARVEALLAPTVGGVVPEHRIDEAGPLSRIALAKSIDNLATAIRATPDDNR